MPRDCEFDEFTTATHGVDLCARHRPAGTGLGNARAGVDSRRHRDANFPRAEAAERVGLHAAFALPIMQGRRVQGVMEFFSRDILEPSPDLLEMMTTICSQIGCYIERKWASDDLDRFFKLSLDLFCVATFDGYLVRVNPAWQTLLGLSEEELRSTPFMEFVHPDDRGPTAAAVRRWPPGRSSSTSRTGIEPRTDRTSGCSGSPRRS